jgi:hypothetical protein
MYKKIIHTIVEEHYDHPMAAKIKAGLKRKQNKKAKYDFGDEDVIFGRPTNEIFNKDEFKQNFDSYLNNYTQKLIQITDSVVGTEEQLITPFEELFDTIDNMKNFFNPFYTRELGEMITTSFRHIASTTTMMTHSIKAGFDYSPWSRSFDRAVIIGPLVEFNDRWAPYNYQNPLRQFKLAIIKRINAVKANDQVAMDQANVEATAAMMSFGQVIYDGIIQKFPQRFTA